MGSFVTSGLAGLEILDDIGLLKLAELREVVIELLIWKILGKAPNKDLPLPLLLVLVFSLVFVESDFNINLAIKNLIYGQKRSNQQISIIKEF